MINRNLRQVINDVAFHHGKMAFMSGPRQCGKTTLAQTLLAERGSGEYYSLDDTVFRRRWASDPSSLTEVADERIKPLFVFDELHKGKQWKRSLKGVYDTQKNKCDILVTGSARLNVYRRGSDSLVGRYFHLRLHPLTLGEILGNPSPLDPSETLSRVFEPDRAASLHEQTRLKELLLYSGFPEPALKADRRFLNNWRRTRLERIIREDLRDLTRIQDLSQIEILSALLPERVGSALKVARIAELVETSHPTATRWLRQLNEIYYCYQLRPYSQGVTRSLMKESKLYLWDYTEVENEAARLENLVANHLSKVCDLWTDLGEGKFDLSYLRTKEQHEIDFLVTKDRKPWLAVEVKLSDGTLSPNWSRFLSALRIPYAIQIVGEPGHWKKQRIGSTDLLVASAAEVLAHF